MSRLSKLAAGLVISTTAAFGGASIALADGYAAKQVAYERPADWSGVYFGVDSGYSWSSFDNKYFAGTPNTWSVNTDNAIVGAHIGLQHQFGAIVLGIEGGYASSFRDNFDTTQCPNPATVCSARFNDVITVGSRLGWTLGHWMPYITGGYATARFEDNVRFKAAPNTLTVLGSERHNGWFIGGGAEWQVSPGWTAGLEYRHYEFGDETYNRFTPAGAPVPGDRATVDVGLDTIMARVSWRWGREPVAAPLK